MDHHRARDGRRRACVARVYRLALLALALLCAVPAHAQPVGTIAALDGTVEVGRGGAWTPAVLAAAIDLGDQVRTGRPGRVRIVFADQSVLDLADASQITVDEQVFDPAPGVARAAVSLLAGKLRALVSDYYQGAGNAYEVRTVTAVAGVRGTSFVVVYDGEADRTEVVGIDGWVAVNGVPARGAQGVRLTTGEISLVPAGAPPSPARRLDDVAFRRYLGGFAFIGAGGAESQVVDLPLIAGTQLPDVDRLALLPPLQIPHTTIPVGTETLIPVRDAGTVAGQPLPIVEAAGRLRIRLF